MANESNEKSILDELKNVIPGNIRSLLRSPRECALDLLAAIDVLEKDIENKNKVIDELRTEAYKDKELKKMKQEIDNIKSRYKHSFGFSEKEYKAIQDWMDKHQQEFHWNKKEDRPTGAGAIGGRFSYEFTPTSIDVLCKVKCACGAEFCFHELEG